MTGLTFRFHTIRATVASVAAEISKTTRERRIVFGPGFPSRVPLEATTVFVNPQTLQGIQAWGEEESENATE
jgi:hypothetical protein